jgi:hypothetical protein
VTAVEQFQAATENLASTTERSALTLYGQYQAGQLDDADFALLLVGLINRANAEAVSLADVWLAVQIEEQLGQPVPTVGVLPKDGSERLVKAVNKVLSDQFRGGAKAIEDFTDARKIAGQDHFSDATKVAGNLDGIGKIAGQDQPTDARKATNAPDMRVERLARAEVFEAAQQATHDAMQQQPLVEGWVRHMDADPCEQCVWWWREGRIWPKAHRMPTHKGCNCQPRVVLAEHIKSTGYTRRLERNT